MWYAVHSVNVEQYQVNVCYDFAGTLFETLTTKFTLLVSPITHRSLR